MTDKDIKDYCKSCDVEPPAMKFKCPVCKHNPDKEIIIDGVDVSGCKHYKINGKCSIPHYQQGIKYENCNCNEWDCYFKQLQKEKFENLNNRQMVESTENLIYENSELIKNLKEKEQECEKYEQVFNKIKKYFKSQDTSKTSLFNIFYVEAEILNIINKAKEKE